MEKRLEIKMTITPGTHSVAIKVYLCDPKEMKLNLGGDITPERLRETLLIPFDDGDIGVTLTDVHIVDGGTYEGQRVDDMPIQVWFVTADVTDANLLTDKLVAHYADKWNDDSWTPENTTEAIFEAFLASNDTASPVDYGYEIVDWKPALVPELPGMEI
jgi:hypothetical protein